MATIPGQHDRLRLLAEPPPPPDEEDDLVDAMDVIATHLATVVALSKIACVLLALVALGVALRVLGV